MALPLTYNLGSLRARWVSAVVAVLGIAGTVGVFVAVLAMARGFQATLVGAGSPDNVLVRRAGTNSELESILTVGDVRVIEDARGVAWSAKTPLVAPEVVVVASLPLRDGGTDALVLLRGTSARVLDVRPAVKLVEGRLFRAGLPEMIAGRHAARNYAGLDMGRSLRLGGADWTVVGVFDAGGTALDSEVWCDADILNQTYQRPTGLFQAATVRLADPSQLETLRRALTSDPRVTVQVEPEREYYERQSGAVTTMITVLGSLVALVMAIGAVFAALNTMYSAVAERSREIATLRALGFGEAAVVVAFLAEALLVGLAGGLVGCLVVLPVNGLTTGTMNWQTFSHVAFAFRVTPALLASGLCFALVMGVLGGLPPALRAARLPVAPALRGL
jgi:putative ABC transport system permease protein